MPSVAPDLATAIAQLAAREPIFHHPEFGTLRRDVERMVSGDFWEVGASGRKYSRQYVLDVLKERHASPVEERYEVSDFACTELAPGLFLVTYQLDQAGRLSRRCTLWRWVEAHWQALYHQGTLIAQDVADAIEPVDRS
ncbi:MAG: DUF4440 domain-containing protein [Proteobacteria bacterium]|nr:DUF4440 domain-containing protein [Pseudomonadota bacterium]